MREFAGRDEGGREEQEKAAEGSRFHRKTKCRLGGFVEQVILEERVEMRRR
jgi:hypothetical protein